MNKRRRRLLAIIAAVLVLLMIIPILFSALMNSTASAVSQAELNDLKDQADELARQQSQLQSQISSLQGEQIAVMSKKQLLDERMSVTRQEIENLTSQIDTYTQMIADKEVELSEAEDAEIQQFEDFKERIRMMEENGTISYYSILFDAKSFSDMLGRIDLISEIMESDRQMATMLEKAKLATAQAKKNLEETKAAQEAAKAEQEQKEQELTVQLEEANELIVQLMTDIDAYSLVFEENEAQEEALQKEIDEMVAELERIEREKASNAAAVVATGSFIWPSESSRRVTSPFGTRLHPILGVYKSHNGIDIGADYGTNILAADGGIVAVSQYSSSYGNYVVINHGNGNRTLCAHMSKRLVSVGDSVEQGHIIGLIGSTGMSTGPHLHFEITINGTRANPLNYYSNYIEAW